MRSINFSTILLVAASSLSHAVGAPFSPSDDDHALERLPHMVAPIRDELRARSSDLATAVRLAQKYVRLDGEESILAIRLCGRGSGALARCRRAAGRCAAAARMIAQDSTTSTAPSPSSMRSRRAIPPVFKHGSRARRS
jgi:hypothetical protein